MRSSKSMTYARWIAGPLRTCTLACVMIFSLSLPLRAQATFSVEGLVRDVTGAVVEGARVELSGVATQRSTSSDASGRYLLQGIPPGRYRLRAERFGFLPVTIDIEITDANATKELTLGNVSTTEAVMVTGVAPGPTLDSPTDTASRLGLTARETPATVSLVTFAEAQSRGLNTTIDALNRLPAVSSAFVPGSPGIVSIRGFSGGAVSTLFDGTRVTTSTMVTRNYDSWSFERIEVLKGPASVLFGEGALAGAVNFVAKRPDFGGRKAEALVSYGSLNTARLAAGVTGPLGKDKRAAYRTDIAWSSTDGRIDGNHSDTLALTGALDFRLSPSATIGLAVEHFRDDHEVAYWGTPLVPRSVARQPSDLVSDSRDYVLDEAMRKTNHNVADGVMDAYSTFIRGKLDWRLSPAWRLSNELSVYDSFRQWKNAEIYTFAPANGLLTRSTVAIDHDHQFFGNRIAASSDTTIGGRRNRFTTGLELNRNDFFNPRRFGTTSDVDPYNPVRGIFPAETADNFPGAGNRVNFETVLDLVSVFAEDALSVAHRVTVVGGARYDRLKVGRSIDDLNTAVPSTFERVFEPVSWRGGVVVDAAPQTQLFAQYTSAVAPVATVLLISQVNAAFDLTTGMSWEGGVKSTLLGGRVEGTASVFKIQQHDILTRDPNNFNVTIQGGTQASTGVELTLSANVTPQLRVDVNAAFLDARFETLIEAGGIDRSGNVPPNVPERNGGLWTSYRFATVPLSIAGGVTYRGAIFTNNANSTRVDGTVLLDLQGGWHLGRGDITLRGKNLTDAVYADWSGASANQLILGAPRTVEVAYHFRF